MRRSGQDAQLYAHVTTPTSPRRRVLHEEDTLRQELALHFAGVDVPTRLVQAHADGDVVFFVGAGASAGPPTNLPLFDSLTKRIAQLTGASYSLEDLQQPDVFLGRLDAREDVDIHDLVAQEIGRRRRRNATHDAIADLASGQNAMRIVTTNYDNLLSQALRAKR